jgi:uncharacterized protein YkwD
MVSSMGDARSRSSRHRRGDEGPKVYLRLLGAGLALLVPLASAPAASAATTAEGRALHLVNEARRNHGLRPLVRTDKLDALAERHSQAMRSRGALFHTADLGERIPGSWKMCGENVAFASTVVRLHRVLMNSGAHRANILRARWDQVGIGIVAASSGQLYETQIFVDR